MTHEKTISVGALISRLTQLADQHGSDAPVYIHDADTDWPMALGNDAVRFGKDKLGDGLDGAIMLKSVGY